MSPTTVVFRLPIIAMLLASSVWCVGADVLPSGPSPVQRARAAKIVGQLAIPDQSQSARVAELIAIQYYGLSIIHAKRDSVIATAKAIEPRPPASEVSIRASRAESEAAQNQLHSAFLASLGAELTPEQIEKVKDGMTYGVVPLTFRVYQQMLPELTQEQKAQILAWLVEAREHAMDASTSEEKHAWFGKYKGRINNYLAKAGYDMKAAENNLKINRS